MKLSIITINYNNKEGLKKTLDSIFHQSFQDFEYIIIDGSSTDGGKEIIEENSEKINYWVSEPDKGVYHAMNKGIKAAKGEYLLFLNSGDGLYNEKTLENLIPLLHTEDIITGNLNFISDKNNFIGISQVQISFIHMYKDTIWHPCSFIKKEAFKKTEMYDENLKICADWKWFLLAIYKYHLTYKKIDLTVSKFFLDGISSSEENTSLIVKERQDALSNIFGFKLHDFIKFEQIIDSDQQLINSQQHLKKLEYKIISLKKSRILKLLYRLRVFKAYKYL